MEIKELKLYTDNLRAYTADNVDELEVMTYGELIEYQRNIENDTGEHSNWDSLRAIITFKHQIRKLEQENSHLRNMSDNQIV